MKNNTSTPYGRQLQDGKEMILAHLKRHGRKNSSELYFVASKALGGNNFAGQIVALRLLHEEGLVTHEHEMVKGYISTDFYQIA